MVKLLGAASIGFCAVYMGASLSCDLIRRVQAVGALRDVLLSMRQKLSARLLPLPALLRETAQEHAGCYSAFLSRSAARLERERRKPADQILSECFRKEAPKSLTEEARRCVLRVFATLGKLDAASQEQMLDRAVEELDLLETRLREDQRRRSRCYLALGLCGGLAITILLV